MDQINCQVSCMSAYKLNDQDFLRDPAPTLARMREEGALVRIKLPLIGLCWMTTTDAAAREVLKDEASFARNPAKAGGKDISRYYWFLPRFMRPLTRNILSLDGEEHKLIRSAVDQSFSRAAIDTLRAEISQVADKYLDQLDTSKPVDITEDYARLLPLDVISALLGIKPELREKLARAIAPISKPTGLITMLSAMPGLYKTQKLLRKEIETIRHNPRDGLLSTLIHDNSDNLTDDEILALAFLLFIAGHETTLHLITDAVFAITEGATFEAPTSLAIEEFMRFFSPVMMTKPLFVCETHERFGQTLAQGDKVIAGLIAANHDPARFDGANDIVTERRPNAHIGFGFGPHVCLGMHLARAEAQIALERLFERFPNLERAPKDAPPVFSERYGMRGMKTLKVRLNP